MGIFARVVKNWTYRSTNGEKSGFIFYKIVDSSKEGKRYLLQCLNTHGMFYSNLNEIVADPNILYGLHPVQACYIGIEYLSQATLKYPVFELRSRYGLYRLSYLDRKNNIVFFNKETLEEFSMPAEKIAFSKLILAEFDAIEAFYIGLLVGEGIAKSNSITFMSATHRGKRPELKVIKGGK